MEGSSPAGASHLSVFPNGPFIFDYAATPATFHDLLAQHTHTGPLRVMATSPMASHHRAGVTTRSVATRRQARLDARSIIDELALTRVMDGTPSSMTSRPIPLNSNMASVPATHECRKRRAESAPRRVASSAKKLRAKPSPKSNLKSPPKTEPVSESKNPPAGLKKDSDYDEGNLEPHCCICMCEPEPASVATINGCQHKFCFECIEKWADRENTCPLCKTRFTKIDRVNKPKRRKGEPSLKGSKSVKTRDQRSIPEAALEGLVASFSATGGGFPHSIARLFFAGVGPAGLFEFGPARVVRAREVRFDNGPGNLMINPSNFDLPTFSDDDDDDDEDNNDPFPAIVDRMRRLQSRSVRFSSTLARATALAPQQVARSYAVNMNESTAGNAQNPLEIEDDSDDDDVEIVNVVTRIE